MVAGDPPPPQHFSKLQKHYWRRYRNASVKTALLKQYNKVVKTAPDASKKEALKATKK